MANITVLGVDISKNIFELCGLDRHAKVCYKKRVTRKNFIKTVIQLNPRMLAIEACSGANHWYRELSKQNIPVKLISPQYVKPFVKTNKNDANDALAIAVAASQGHMVFVSPKNLEQQDIQSLLRIRERLKINRVKLINEARGLLLEYGVAIAKGANKFYQKIAEVIEDQEERLTPVIKRSINRMYVELLNIDEEVSYYEKELTALFNASSVAQSIGKVPGVGILTAMSITALVGDVGSFKNGRHFSAYLGLVPRQHSSGSNQTLLGISKRGNVFVRTLLIHGARAVLAHVGKRTDRKSVKLKALIERRGFNRACVALANKNARIIWAMMHKKSSYEPNLAW